MIVDIEMLRIVASLTNEDLEEIARWKFEREIEEYVKSLTIDDIHEAVSSGIVKPSKISKKRLEEMGFKHVDDIIKLLDKQKGVIYVGETSVEYFEDTKEAVKHILRMRRNRARGNRGAHIQTPRQPVPTRHPPAVQEMRKKESLRSTSEERRI